MTVKQNNSNTNFGHGGVLQSQTIVACWSLENQSLLIGEGAFPHCHNHIVCGVHNFWPHQTQGGDTKKQKAHYKAQDTHTHTHARTYAVPLQNVARNKDFVFFQQLLQVS